ncbi:helix-turn-helix domain-containing protein [Streptomyces sp. NPDC051563]|uniref:helix-turn-helix domain-containing protein n=1 Tax=Streptomyces sp. NPDC051563 TaxID=3365659 RepID=UPI0037921606
MTTTRTLSRQSAPSTAPQGLPVPAERRRLRELWDLTPQQVAVAFGVRAATVRSWEAGRSAPTGKRREAYRRFLQGLAQRADLGEREACLPASRSPESPVRPRPALPGESRLQTGPLPKRDGEGPANSAAPGGAGTAGLVEQEGQEGQEVQDEQPGDAGWQGLAAGVAILSGWLLVLVLLGMHLPGWTR